MTCPTEDAWLAFLDGSRPDDAPRLEAHLDVCSACRQLTAAIVRSQPARATPASTPSFQLARERLEGAVLGRYFLIDRVGEGGMGVVYRAYDPSLDRRIAVKLIKHALRSGPAQHSRLLDEARSLAKISHPNVITVHDVGEVDGQVFIAMELVEGPSLRAWCANRTWPEIFELLLQAGHGLFAAHQAGLVHGDFKPDNVLVSSRGTALVTDFGLAKPVEASGANTEALAGTLAYMAPEQLALTQASPASDQFAFCVTAHELLFRHRPGSPLEGPASGAPEALRRVLLKGLSKNPEARAPTLGALLAELEAIGRRTRQARVQRFALGAVALGLLAVLGFDFNARRERARCEQLGHELDPGWNDERRATIKQAFLSSQLPIAAGAFDRLDARLERYAHDWVAARQFDCQEASKQPLEVRTFHQQCLRGAREQLEALTQTLTQADAETVRRGVNVANALVPLSTCSAPSAPAGFRAFLEPEASKTLALLEADLAAGHSEQAARGLSTFVAGLAPGHPVLANARFALQRALLKSGQLDEAERSLMMAVGAAQRAARDDLFAIECTNFAYALADRGQRLEAARTWVLLAQAAADRLGRPMPSLTFELERTLGVIAARSNDLPGAEAHFRASLAQAELEHDDVVIAGALNNLIVALGPQQKLDEALAVTQRALKLTTAALGADHPEVIAVLTNRALILTYAARMPEAYALQEPLVTLARRAFGPKHLTLARTLSNAVNVGLATNHAEHLVEWASESVAIETELLGVAHPETLHAQAVLGAAHQLEQHPTEALAACRTALVGFDALPKADAAEVANAAGCVADALLSLHRAPEALPLLERAVQLINQPGQWPLQRAQLLFLLARALRDASKPPARARALAETALKIFDEAHLKTETEQVRSWLRDQ